MKSQNSKKVAVSEKLYTMNITSWCKARRRSVSDIVLCRVDGIIKKWMLTW